jgi:hypothetical protein
MAQFIQMGKYWLNLDLVRIIQQLTSSGNPGQTTGLRVYFSDGTDQTFKDAAEMQALESWLKAHKAP